jgi:ribosome-associated protein
VKAQHIAVFNTEQLSAMFERVIIASGTSNRQTKALAASVRDSVRSNGFQVMSTEGEDNGEWIIVDCGAAVAHIMQPAIREYYHLEEIWGGKNVKMKMGVVNTKLVKASEPEKPAKKSAAKTGASAGAKKAAVKTTARPAAKAPARAPAGSFAKAPTRAPAKSVGKTAAAKPAAGKTSTKTATKTATKTTARKAADKSAAYQRVGARRPSAKTSAAAPAARKAPARKTPRSS